MQQQQPLFHPLLILLALGALAAPGSGRAGHLIGSGSSGLAAGRFLLPSGSGSWAGKFYSGYGSGGYFPGSGSYGSGDYFPGSGAYYYGSGTSPTPGVRKEAGQR